MAKLVFIGAAVAVVVLVVLVLVGNFAVERTNPPVTFTINWDSPETEQLVRAACFDCHSHETRWPWYAHIAPPAFLLANHVNEGRSEMNFSTGHNLRADEMIEEIERGNMPPADYLLLHPEASFNAEQKAQLIAGLRATFPAGFRFQRGGG